MKGPKGIQILYIGTEVLVMIAIVLNITKAPIIARIVALIFAALIGLTMWGTISIVKRGETSSDLGLHGGGFYDGIIIMCYAFSSATALFLGFWKDTPETWSYIYPIVIAFGTLVLTILRFVFYFSFANAVSRFYKKKKSKKH